jgi:HTH-type transcriptional regulator/antitoxin HigA
MINRPIRTEAEYKAALAEIEPYFAREPEADSAEADRFDLLTLLIEAYEEQHHPIGPPHPVEMIRHRMRTAGYKQADLGELLGSRARASEVLARKRRLTLPMIWKLSQQWNIPAEALVAPYRLASESRQRSPARPSRRKAA